jgi:methylthioribose-1-phosphate isomerase
LKSARPTAINLSWAIARLESILEDPKVEEKNLPELIRLEAKKIEAEEAQSCAEVGRWGARLIKDGDRILTYCNTGRLATPGMGTALGVIYQANKLGRRFEVIVCETRPLLQGARLTTFELLESGIPTCLITDNALARVMPTIDKVIVGADRIALDGSVANKIGTYMLAIMAHYFKIPFYVAAPLSTIDPNSSLGAEIPIEYRDAQEVTHLAGRRIAPQGIRVMNPAFDVTPPELLSGIITEKGIITPPFKDRIKELAQEP